MAPKIECNSVPIVLLKWEIGETNAIAIDKLIAQLIVNMHMDQFHVCIYNFESLN